MSGRPVGKALDRAIAAGTAPRSITVDHGTEFMSRALEDWAFARGVQLDFIRPRETRENALSRPQWPPARRVFDVHSGALQRDGDGDVGPRANTSATA